MSADELAAIGVEVHEPPTPSEVDHRFYFVSSDGSITPRPIEAIRETLKQQVEDERWNLQVSGVVVNGIPVRTDAYTLAEIIAAHNKAVADPTFVVNVWRVSYLDENNQKVRIYPSFDATALIAIHDAVQARIQGLISRNKDIDAAIDALATVEEAEAFTWTFEGV